VPRTAAPSARDVSGAADDPIAQFGRLLRESAERERAEQRRREEAARAAREAEAARRAHERALAEARRELERAIAAVRSARAAGRGQAEADAAWRAAKARVIELETGAPPPWAPPPATPAGEADPDSGADAREPALADD
jgi:hypothetical protein